jgi:hypothetical protein
MSPASKSGTGSPRPILSGLRRFPVPWHDGYAHSVTIAPIRRTPTTCKSSLRTHPLHVSTAFHPTVSVSVLSHRFHHAPIRRHLINPSGRIGQAPMDGIEHDDTSAQGGHNVPLRPASEPGGLALADALRMESTLLLPAPPSPPLGGRPSAHHRGGPLRGPKAISTKARRRRVHPPSSLQRSPQQPSVTGS